MSYRFASGFRPNPVLLALGLCSLSGVALADDDDAATAIDTVVVTASRAATPLRETPASLGVIGRDAIDAKRPSFLGEVLNSIPGVYMTDLSNEQHNMSIRQPLSYSAVYLYLEDGIPIRPLGLFNHNALYEINLDGAGSVEVVKGPSSSLYGSNSVGGTVNFLTEAPSATPTARVGVQGSDQGYWRADLAASGTSGEVGGRIAGYTSKRNGGWQDYNDAEKDSLTGRGDWDISANTHLTGVITHNYLKTDMPGSLFANDYRTRPGYSYNHFTYREVTADRASLALSGDWFAAGTTTVTVYGRDNSTAQLPSYLIFNSAANPASATGRQNDSDFTSLGLDARQVLDFDVARSRLVFGLNVDDTDNDYVEDNLAIDRDPASGAYLGYTVTGNRRDYTVDLSNRAFYAQYELSPVEDVRLVVGARQDDIEYDYTNHKTPSATTGAPSEVRDFDHVSPKLAAVWSPSPTQSFFVNLAEGFTPPEVSSLYGRLAAPDLKESVFRNEELGWRGHFLDGAVAVDLTAYRLTGEDEVVSFTITPGNSEPRNAGKTRHQGLEAGLNWTVSEEWALDVALARSEHEYRDYRVSAALDYSGNDIPAAPKWLGNMELVYAPGFMPGLTAALGWVHMGEYWMDNANTVRYPGHDLTNLRLAYTTGAWTFWAKATNLGDEHYAEIAASSYTGAGTYNPNTMDTYTPGAPRTAFIGVNYRYGGE